MRHVLFLFSIPITYPLFLGLASEHRVCCLCAFCFFVSLLASCPAIAVAVPCQAFIVIVLMVSHVRPTVELAAEAGRALGTARPFWSRIQVHFALLPYSINGNGIYVRSLNPIYPPTLLFVLARD